MTALLGADSWLVADGRARAVERRRHAATWQHLLDDFAARQTV